MLWITPVAADLESVMTSNEAAIAQRAVSVGTPDRTPEILANLIAEIRGMIATWVPNSISADPTKIPPSFKARFLVLARGRVLTGLPGYAQSDERKAEAAAAEAWLLLVAKGIIRPEPADDAVTTGVPSEKYAPKPQINARERYFQRDQQQGI